MEQINWTVLVLMVMGLFALAGYFKGWWKEAITTFFLATLIFFLRVPDAAQLFINAINSIIAAIWNIMPNFILDFFESILGIGAVGAPPQFDAGSAQTWIIMLIIFIGLAILIGRLAMPSSGRRADEYAGYVVTFGGSLFGALLGAINGWLIISLVRSYLDGRNLPGGGDTIAAAIAPPVDQVAVQAVGVPVASIADSPWLFVAIGVAIFLMALKARVAVKENKGFRKIDYKPPLGYEKTKMTRSSS
jgi:hypothetical protein